MSKKHREKIFELFLYTHRLRFSDIEKQISIRSNLLAHEIQCMQKEGILEKKSEYYSLTKNAEKKIPYWSKEQESSLNIILVGAIHKNKVLLIKRTKRPYKEYWSLIGGKVKIHESLEDASTRIVFEKAGIRSAFKSVNGIMHEQVIEESQFKHNFMLVFTTVNCSVAALKAGTAGEVAFFTPKQIQGLKIVPSDKWFIDNRLDKRIDMNHIVIEDKGGVLHSHTIKDVNKSKQQV